MLAIIDAARGDEVGTRPHARREVAVPAVSEGRSRPIIEPSTPAGEAGEFRLREYCHDSRLLDKRTRFESRRGDLQCSRCPHGKAAQADPRSYRYTGMDAATGKAYPFTGGPTLGEFDATRRRH